MRIINIIMLYGLELNNISKTTLTLRNRQAIRIIAFKNYIWV